MKLKLEARNELERECYISLIKRLGMGEEDNYKYNEVKKMSGWIINLKYDPSLK